MNSKRSYALSLKAPQSRGFTLVELIVVIAIIAVLTSLLLPAISTGSKRAANAKCMSNLRQIGIAMSQYLADPANGQAYPSIWSSNTNANTILGPQPSTRVTPNTALGPYGFTNSLIYCPADTNKTRDANYTNYGSYAWTPILKSDTNNVNAITSTKTNIFNIGGLLQIPSASLMTICVDSVSRHLGTNGTNGTMNVLRADGHVESQ